MDYMIWNRKSKKSKRVEQATSTIKSSKEPEEWENLVPEELSAVAFSLYTTYGRTRDVSMQPDVRKMHALLVERLPEADRLSLAQLIARFIEEVGATSEFSLLPFILGESSLQIISSTVIDYAMFMEGPESEDMPGPNFLIKQYKFGKLPDVNRLGILAGLILLGDERLLPLVLGRWADFKDPSHRQYLAGVQSGFVSTLQVEFLLDWIENTSDESEIGGIAGGLGSMPRNSNNEVVTRLSRSFPYGRAGGDDPLRVIQTWSFPEYEKLFLADRLKLIIECESEPKVLPMVLDLWRR